MTSLFGLLGHSIFLMALLLALLQVRRWKKYWPVTYFISAILIILPIQDWLLIEFSRGYFSDLSFATIFVCGFYILNSVKTKPASISIAFKLLIVTLSVVLFPATLGASMFDPFSLGYVSTDGFSVMVVFVALIGLIAWYKNEVNIALYVAMALTAFSLNIYESKNLWVYMIDPIAMLLCVFSLLWSGIKRFVNKVKIKEVENV